MDAIEKYERYKTFKNIKNQPLYQLLFAQTRCMIRQSTYKTTGFQISIDIGLCVS